VYRCSLNNATETARKATTVNKIDRHRRGLLGMAALASRMRQDRQKIGITTKMC
jgi:hypothetical protein